MRTVTRFLFTICGVLALSLTTFAGAASADPAIHEIVAAYCSGGGVGVINASGFLAPPGITDPTASNFAKPVRASGAVQGTFPTITVTDKPNAKYEEGTSVFALTEASADHPSAAHCPGAAALPGLP